MPAMPPAKPVRENDGAPSEQVRAPTRDAAPMSWAEGAEETRFTRMPLYKSRITGLMEDQ